MALPEKNSLIKICQKPLRSVSQIIFDLDNLDLAVTRQQGPIFTWIHKSELEIDRGNGHLTSQVAQKIG
jgi:hypothetical protein